MRTSVIIMLCLLLAGTALFAQPTASRQSVSIGINEIKDYKGLAVKLRAPNDPVSGYIAGKLSQQTTLLMMKLETASEPGEQLKASLVSDLNGLLNDQKFYSEARFKSFKLPDSLLAQSAKPRFKGTAALARFNKQLIAIAYAAEFSRAAPKPVEQAKAEPPKPAVEDSAYTAANLAFAKGLAQRLKQPKDNLTKYIEYKLSKPTRDTLKKYDGQANPSPWLAAALAADLNKLLADPKLYDTKRFKDVTLIERAKQRLAAAKDLKGADLARLNKSLLDEAYTTGLPPVASEGPPKPKTTDTTQVRDLRPASSLATTTAGGSDLTVGNLMLSAPDTIYTTHLWVEGTLNQKLVWRDSFSIYGDTTSGLDIDAKSHWDRSWSGPSWGNYQIVNLHYHTGRAKVSSWDMMTSTKHDSTINSYNLDWGLTLGGKKYLGNSPFFFFAENQDSQALQKGLPDSNSQVDVFISGGTGYGQVIDLANYVRAKKFEQALLKEGIIARLLPRAAMSEMIKILQLRKTSQDRVVLVNKMLTERGLVVKTTYTYDTIFLLTEILDQSTDQLESGLEIRAYFRQQLMAQQAFDRQYLYGFGMADIKYARPITLSMQWISKAHYFGVLSHKGTIAKGTHLYEYGAETGVKYTKALSEMSASFELLKPFYEYPYAQLKYMLHAKYAYKILNKVELSANYDFTIEKNSVMYYSAIDEVKYRDYDTVKRSEINLRLKYYFF